MGRKIWFTTDLYRGGLGDFLVGALGTYSLCRKAGYDFDIYIPEQNPLSAAFDVSTEKPLYSKQLILDAGMYDAAEVRRRIEREFRGFPFKVIAVSTNVAIATEEEMNDVVDDFMQHLQPSAEVRAIVAAFQKQLGVRAGEYDSIHIRCGDAYMRSATINPGDNRMTPQAAVELLKRAATSLPNTLIVHSDSEVVKRQVTGLKVSPAVIQHTGERGDTYSYLQTVADFFLMVGANKIYSNIDSGFSRLASLWRGVYVQPLGDSVAKAEAEAAAQAAAAQAAAAQVQAEVEEVVDTVENEVIVPPPPQTKKNKKNK